MRRRHVIVGLGCLIAWPFVAQARQPATAVPTSSPPGSVAAPSPHLAQVSPDRLVVTRTRNNLNNPDAPPFDRTITDRKSVEKLYQDILTLPPLPAGRFDCPRDVGIRYRLDFYAGSTLFLSGDYAPTGCRTVSLSSGTVKIDSSDSFRADLVRALGFSSEHELLG